MQWRVAPSALPELHRCTARRAHTHWTTFRLAVHRDTIRGASRSAAGDPRKLRATSDRRCGRRIVRGGGRARGAGLRGRHRREGLAAPRAARPRAAGRPAARRRQARRDAHLHRAHHGTAAAFLFADYFPPTRCALFTQPHCRCSWPTGPPTRPCGSTRKATTSPRTTWPGSTLR